MKTPETPLPIALPPKLNSAFFGVALAGAGAGLDTVFLRVVAFFFLVGVLLENHDDDDVDFLVGVELNQDEAPPLATSAGNGVVTDVTGANRHATNNSDQAFIVRVYCIAFVLEVVLMVVGVRTTQDRQ